MRSCYLAVALYLICFVVHAGPVQIPDVNLHADVVAALGIPHDSALTADDIARLTHLQANDSGITEPSGLETATQLVNRSLCADNIFNLSPLARLTYLTLLQTNSNRIVDVAPLAGIINLAYLIIDRDRIVDVRILAGLNQFQTLEIHQNRIVDHNPLDGLPLSHFTDDQKCDKSPLPLEPRLQNRSLPSIFARCSGFD